MNGYKMFGLVLLTLIIAILLGSALNSPSARVADTALAASAPDRGRVTPLLQDAPRTTALKYYLPIIFLNSTTAGGAWLLAGNAGTNPANDFLGTLDTQPLVLKTNNVERMRIDTGGNVGIGKSPGVTLDVSGTVRADHVFAVNGLSTSSTTKVSNLNADQLDGLDAAQFARTDNSNTMAGTLSLPANGLVVGTNQLVATGGNIGIGTATPNSKLQVSGNYIQIPTVGSAPPAGDCNSASQAGRMIIRTDTAWLYLCLGASGWITK